LAPLIGLVVPLGPVDSKAKGASRVGSEVSLRYPTGLRVSGTLVRELRDHDGQLAAYLLANAELGSVALAPERHATLLLPIGQYRTAFAGAAHSSYYPKTDPRNSLVPRSRHQKPSRRELEQLYSEALTTWRQAVGSDIVPLFEKMHQTLEAHFPNEWLLRWNLLESLLKLGYQGKLVPQLEEELERLEIRFDHVEPIATGLSYLRGQLGLGDVRTGLVSAGSADTPHTQPGGRNDR
jgi:hypothetical protein